jgi:membrane protein DedA with SNARE-associated domain
MLDQLIINFTQYSYLAIFLLIFLQEVGLPSPFPNELVLIFSGYLTYNGVFKLPLVILIALSGDILAGGILFLLFYFFGNVILQRKPKWLLLPQKKLEHISEKINNSGQSGIFIGRLTPLIRGYVAVLCGLLHVLPGKYSITLLTTSTIWAAAYICCGYLMGPYWNLIIQSNYNFKYLMIIIPVSAAIILTIIHFFKKYATGSNQQKI